MRMGAARQGNAFFIIALPHHNQKHGAEKNLRYTCTLSNIIEVFALAIAVNKKLNLQD